jgi:predicted nucleic acid-binding protein
LIHFLVDSSAVWRMQRQPEITEGWDAPLLSGAIGSCEPQRAEFRRSARNAAEFDQMNRMFAELYPDVPVPKSVWRWIDAAQHRLAGAGAARALSVVDLLVCGTAAIPGLAILHDDADYELAARHLTDIQTRRVVPFTD